MSSSSLTTWPRFTKKFSKDPYLQIIGQNDPDLQKSLKTPITFSSKPPHCSVSTTLLSQNTQHIYVYRNIQSKIYYQIRNYTSFESDNMKYNFRFGNVFWIDQSHNHSWVSVWTFRIRSNLKIFSNPEHEYIMLEYWNKKQLFPYTLTYVSLASLNHLVVFAACLMSAGLCPTFRLSRRLGRIYKEFPWSNYSPTMSNLVEGRKVKCQCVPHLRSLYGGTSTSNGFF